MEKQILLVVGLVLMVGGYGLHLYALAKYRTAAAPGLMPKWRSGRPRREWFVSEYGYQLHNTARWMMGFGGLISLVGGLLQYPS